MNNRIFSLGGQVSHDIKIELSEENAQAQKLALLLPGMAYRVDHPIFYFARALLHDLGYRTASLHYAYDKIDGFRDQEFARVMETFAEDAKSIYASLSDQPSSDELVVVGKSLGTMIMAQMLANNICRDAKLAWLTPSLGVPECEQQLKKHAQQSFVAIGTADPSYNAVQLEEIEQAGATMCVLDSLAHVLESPNNVPKSILGHHQMISALSDWLAN